MTTSQVKRRGEEKKLPIIQLVSVPIVKLFLRLAHSCFLRLLFYLLATDRQSTRFSAYFTEVTEVAFIVNVTFMQIDEEGKE